MPDNANDFLSSILAHYDEFLDAVNQANTRPSVDTFVLRLLQNDLLTFTSIVEEHRHVFTLYPEDFLQIQDNLGLMTLDLRVLVERAQEASNRGRPEIVRQERNGERGRPRTLINEDFLRYAYSRMSTSGIARYLGVSRTVVRQALLDMDIASAGFRPFPSETDDSSDDALHIPENDPLPTATRSTRGYLSNISDNDLDNTLLELQTHFPRAGIKTMQGMLNWMGHIVPYHRIRASILRIDPIRRTFERITIRRRVYTVPGPNYLWHHDGHHAIIRWGIVVHGFIDGHSRLITALKASNNNFASTVLSLFLGAAKLWGVPSRVRGDHGGENLWVAAFMEQARGAGRGSYIWGRSVHNVRIERLWVDVHIHITSTWSDRFTELEIESALEINNPNHIWLLHLLFLPIINQAIEFWRHSWNRHRLAVRDGDSRAPEDRFVFDMLAHGFRGDSLDSLALSEEELETFGVDWEGLRDETLLRQLRASYSGDGSDSRFRGTPDNLNQVEVEPPPCQMSSEDIESLLRHVSSLPQSSRRDHVQVLWLSGLSKARQIVPDCF